MVERTVTIDAPPNVLYDLVMDPGRLEDWVSIHKSLDEAPPGRLEKGSRLTQGLKLAGTPFHVQWTVVENEPNRHVVWDGKGPVGSHARVEYRFQPEGDGTRFSYVNDYDLPGGPLGRVAQRAVARVTERELERSLQRLKALVE